LGQAGGHGDQEDAHRRKLPFTVVVAESRLAMPPPRLLPPPPLWAWL